MDAPPATPQHSDHSGRSAPGGSAVQLPRKAETAAYAGGELEPHASGGKNAGATTAEPLADLRNSPLFEGLVQQVQSMMAANGGSLPSFLAFPPLPGPVADATPTPIIGAAPGAKGGQGDANVNESVSLQLTTPSSLDLFASPAPSQASLGLYPLMSQLQGQVHALQGQVHALRAQEGVLRAEMDRIAAERDYLDSAAGALEAEKDILTSELTHAREGMVQYSTLLRAGQELEEYAAHMEKKMEAMAARISQLLKEKEDWAASQAHLAILARVSLVERSMAERWGGGEASAVASTTPHTTAASTGGSTEEEEHTGAIIHQAKKARRAQPQPEEQEEARAPYSKDVTVDLSPTGYLTAQVAKLKQTVAELQLKLTISASALRRMREESVSRATTAASHHAKVVRDMQSRHEGELAQREEEIAALKALLAEAKGAVGTEQQKAMEQEDTQEEKAAQA